MISRQSAKRKYRPGFEGLERKLYLSAGLQAGVAGPPALVQATALTPPGPGPAGILPCGPGKGIVIITSKSSMR